MEAILALTCAALLYLVTEELLVEAHKALDAPETPLTTAAFFVGFVVLFLTGMLVQSS